MEYVYFILILCLECVIYLKQGSWEKKLFIAKADVMIDDLYLIYQILMLTQVEHCNILTFHFLILQ